MVNGYTRQMPLPAKPDHPLRREVLAMLACPVCHAELAPADEQEIVCTGCGRRYPVRDGLPVLLAAAARDPQP